MLLQRQRSALKLEFRHQVGRPRLKWQTSTVHESFDPGPTFRRFLSRVSFRGFAPCSCFRRASSAYAPCSPSVFQPFAAEGCYSYCKNVSERTREDRRDRWKARDNPGRDDDDRFEPGQSSPKEDASESPPHRATGQRTGPSCRRLHAITGGNGTCRESRGRDSARSA